ncbi:MAG: acyltransferase [Planctomycetota bacterium]|nr:acyltransferase [Planctomycetota bacterium]MDA1214796.1 acyltransferase [Planctomycetota bacterium]
MNDSFEHGIPANRYNPHCWITGEPEIGEGTWIGAFTLIDGQGGLKIGKGCDISSGAKILTHSTVNRCISERKYDTVDRMSTVIEDHVFIGTNAVVLMGSHIGHHSVIAAGAVVLEESVVPAYTLMAGVPARPIEDLRVTVEQLMQTERRSDTGEQGRCE